MLIRENAFRVPAEYFKPLTAILVYPVIDYELQEDYRKKSMADQVHEEWLMMLIKSGFAPLFTRATDSLGKTEIDIESKFARKRSKERNLAEVLKESIQENQRNQLFLYKLHDNGIKKAEKIVDWFRGLRIIFPETSIT